MIVAAPSGLAYASLATPSQALQEDLTSARAFRSRNHWRVIWPRRVRGTMRLDQSPYGHRLHMACTFGVAGRGLHPGSCYFPNNESGDGANRDQGKCSSTRKGYGVVGHLQRSSEGTESDIGSSERTSQ